MPVHDLGYRGWAGTLAPGSTRWLVITTTGVRRAWQSGWLRRLLFFAWLPALWFGVGFFIFEQSTVHPEWREALVPFILSANISEIVTVEALQNPGGARHEIWAFLLLNYFRIPQAVMMVIIVGLIGPPLISQDIRSRAFLLYFSRPITRWEYIAGKAGTIWFYLSMISLVPALCVYALGILLSPQLEVLQYTWDLPLRIIVASLSLIFPISALALFLSSMTQESRIAGFAWFAIWVLGWVTYITASAAMAPMSAAGTMPWWTNLSLYHSLGRIQNWIFGLSDFEAIRVPLLCVLGLTIVSVLMVFRRVSAPMRA